MASFSKNGWTWFTEPQPYWALVAFLVLTFLTGGGSRADIQSLIVLRPAAMIFCGIALWSLKWAHVKAHKSLFIISATIFGLVGSHLIPLPPLIWQALPGREIIVEISNAVELGKVWRPMAMVPSAAWNALYSLFVPLAVLLLGVQLSRQQRAKLLLWVLGLGLFSGFWGLLQAIGDPQGPLYLYQVTNNGSAVGLFSNRNHQAILLAMLFPMLAIYACVGITSEEQAKVRSSLALAAGAVLVPLLLVTGSRAGLIVGVLALISTTALYHKPKITVPRKRKGNKRDLRWMLIAFGVICLGGLTIFMSRAEAFQRIIAPDQTENLRFKVWGPIISMAWKYFPFGSGVGSFVEVYQIDEPLDLLSIDYFNHAHNDFVETFMTTGLFGILIIFNSMVVFAKFSWKAFRSNPDEVRGLLFSRLGAVVIAIFVLGSIGDYTLRTPSLASVLVIAVLWLTNAHTSSQKGGGSDDRAELRSADVF